MNKENIKDMSLSSARQLTFEKECIMRVTGRMHLRLKESIKIPEAAKLITLDLSMCNSATQQRLHRRQMVR
jgi:hypothetical protein